MLSSPQDPVLSNVPGQGASAVISQRAMGPYATSSAENPQRRLVDSATDEVNKLGPGPLGISSMI
ncbi:hypothetical protein PpBr36_00171 [Pyricularia pennisetigena]|uniref:hypothetical protein n=1 Tax=Pyricularia pennisetigena TaxID=1578925 RepID=UPI00114E708D|nr:hypothetical protein PpBr36_00171 [Pyricularia pennisetigena]TLS28273.1 hypothetical protein PpBr36_00171 [Pyricularia pennisetigena]